MKIIKNHAEEGCIKISWYTEKTDLLGPFFRFVLWVQGCERRCRGCIAEHMQSCEGGENISIDKLASLIISSPDTEGITISGGEPFYQADRLCSLLETVKKERSDFGVIIYTGYTCDELKNSGEEAVLKLLEMTDILIDGPYIEELDDNAGLRGSSNQNVRFLTNHYAENAKQYNKPSGRRVSFIFTDDRTRMIGVPSQAAKEILKKTGLKNLPESSAGNTN